MSIVTFAVPHTVFEKLALQVFEQFCPKAGDANPLVAERETDFNAKWLFKVIYFGITEEPVRGYIA